LICFALKANSSLAVLRELAILGSGADIVSAGELHRALRAGIPAEKIVFAGVGKREDEIREAIKRSILMFNVESAQELRLIDQIAGRIRKKAAVSLRVNPNVDAHTHRYISTGMQQHKFGVPIEKAMDHYSLAESLKNLEMIGIHMHLGSQILRATPFSKAMSALLGLIDQLSKRGIQIRYLDMGGGFGIAYGKGQKPLAPDKVAHVIVPKLKRRDLTLILEPGRSITGDAGILLTRVLYRKKSGNKEFVVVDAGMNDLIRPSLYDAHHEIIPIASRNGKSILADVVGPVCETADFLGLRRKLPDLQTGELLAVLNAGAYGYSMSSNYNSRPRAAEVLVDGESYRLIRKRETLRDLIRGEL